MEFQHAYVPGEGVEFQHAYVPGEGVEFQHAYVYISEASSHLPCTSG